MVFTGYELPQFLQITIGNHRSTIVNSPPIQVVWRVLIMITNLMSHVRNLSDDIFIITFFHNTEIIARLYTGFFFNLCNYKGIFRQPIYIVAENYKLYLQFVGI